MRHFAFDEIHMLWNFIIAWTFTGYFLKGTNKMCGIIITYSLGGNVILGNNEHRT
jgi:hypothetical protein